MNETMIRRYVREILLEKIRSKRGVKNRYGSEQFNFEQFKKMPSSDAMIAYAETYLTELGHGGSRVTFVFTGDSVLKIAMNSGGIAQNEAEINIHTTPPPPKSIPGTQVTTEIYDMDDDYRWLTAQIVKPMPPLDSETFKMFTGLTWEEFKKIANGDRMKINDNVGISREAQKMIVAVQYLMDKLGLKSGDIFKIEHWGNDGSGQMLLLDYGFTVDVHNKHPELSRRPGAVAVAPVINSTPLPGIRMPSDKPQQSLPDDNFKTGR